MADNELIMEIPSHIIEGMKLIEDEKRIREKIKVKKHELEKAYSELSIGDKDQRYLNILYEQKTRADEQATMRMDALEGRYEKDCQHIKNLYDELETKYQKEKERIHHLEEEINTKFEVRKKKYEAEAKDKRSYFEGEITRINQEKKSTPKTRAIEFDLVQLYKERADLEIKQYGRPMVIPDDSFMPEAERQKLIDIREDAIQREREAEEKKAKLKEQHRLMEQIRQEEKQREAEVARQKELERQERVRLEEEAGGVLKIWNNNRILLDTKKKRPIKTVS